LVGTGSATILRERFLVRIARQVNRKNVPAMKHRIFAAHHEENVGPQKFFACNDLRRPDPARLLKTGAYTELRYLSHTRCDRGNQWTFKAFSQILRSGESGYVQAFFGGSLRKVPLLP
jgi:hypothetical protein